MGNRKVNWEKLKSEYISGGLSYRALAEKYGVVPSVVSARGSKEGWYKSRIKFQNDVVKKAVRKQERKQSDIFSKELKLLGKLEKALDKALDDSDQFYRYLDTEGIDGSFGVVEAVHPKMDMRAVKDAMSVIKMVESTKRQMKGILSMDQQESLAMAREKLELEKRKVDISEPDGDIKVVFEDIDENYCG